MKKAIIVDLDGTLCDHSHRLHYLQGDKKQWDKFYAGIRQDELNETVYEIIKRFESDHAVFFITGRPANIKIVMDTLDWLINHNITYIDIFFRDEGDFSPATKVKRDLYEKYLKDEYDVKLVLEDTPGVVDMWRELGLETLQTEYIDVDDEENSLEVFKNT